MLRTSRRFLQDQTKFYQSYNLQPFTSVRPDKLNLKQLSLFSRHLTQNKVIQSANYVRRELCIRLAHRISSFHETLPFIVGRNPRISLVYSLYFEAFERLCNGFDEVLARSGGVANKQQQNGPQFKYQISTLDDNLKFCNLLQTLLKSHEVVISNLAAGILECSPYFNPSQGRPALMDISTMDKFISDLLRSRIGRRVLAEQHIVRSEAFVKQQPDDGKFGIVDPNIVAGKMVERCAHLAHEAVEKMVDREDNPYDLKSVPDVLVEGDISQTFLYIPDHIEYILFELLKNALWVSTQFNYGTASHPVVVTICTHPSPEKLKLQDGLNKKQLALKSPVPTSSKTKTVIFRLSDRGGGFPAYLLPKEDKTDRLWSFSHINQLLLDAVTPDNPDERQRLNVSNDLRILGKLSDNNDLTDEHKSLKIGLQLARAFAKYWGGDVRVESMRGYGCDVYVSIDTNVD